MVQISVLNGAFSLEVLGLHKLLALKSRLEFPLSSVVSVRLDPQLAYKPSGWKAPGTYIPRILLVPPSLAVAAGTFYSGGKRWFWDVCNPDKALIIEIEGEKYQMLVVEVEKPSRVIGQIRAARKLAE